MFYNPLAYDNAETDLQVLVLEMKVLEMEFAYSGLLQKWQAEDIYNEVLPKYKMLDASDIIWNQLGWYYEEVKRCLSSAVDCYRLVLRKREKVCIHKHPQLCEVLLSLSRVTLQLNDLKNCQIYSAWCIKQICNLRTDYERSTFYLYSITIIVENVISRQRNVNKSYSVFIHYAERFSNLSFLERIGWAVSFLVKFFKKHFCDYRRSVEFEEQIPLKGYLFPSNSFIRGEVVV